MQRPASGALAAILAGGVCGSATVHGQAIALRFDDGRVTLHAENASVREILERWAEVGHVTVLNRERLPNTRVSIRFDDVPEGQALAMLLRDVAGYMLMRRADSPASASIDRIVIMPASSGSMPPAVLPLQAEAYGDTTFTTDATANVAPLPHAQGFRPNDSAAAQPGRQASGTGLEDIGASGTQPGVYTGEGVANQPTRAGGLDAGAAGGSSDPDDQSRYAEIRERDRQANEAGNIGSAAVGSAVGSARPGEVSPAPLPRPEPARNPER